MGFAMKDDSDRREGQTGVSARNPKQDLRQDRLKQALRENLKRRKTQARGRDDLTQISSKSPSSEAASSRSVSSDGNEPSPYRDDENEPDE
jgi:hypothetical protein